MTEQEYRDSRIKNNRDDTIMIDGVEFGMNYEENVAYIYLKEVWLSDISHQVENCAMDNELSIDDEKVSEISMAILDDICEVDGVFMEGEDLFFMVDLDAIEYYKNISIEIEKAMKEVDEILDNIDNYVIAFM